MVPIRSIFEDVSYAPGRNAPLLNGTTQEEVQSAVFKRENTVSVGKDVDLANEIAIRHVFAFQASLVIPNLASEHSEMESSKSHIVYLSLELHHTRVSLRKTRSEGTAEVRRVVADQAFEAYDRRFLRPHENCDYFVAHGASLISVFTTL